MRLRTADALRSLRSSGCGADIDGAGRREQRYEPTREAAMAAFAKSWRRNNRVLINAQIAAGWVALRLRAIIMEHSGALFDIDNTEIAS